MSHSQLANSEGPSAPKGVALSNISLDTAVGSALATGVQSHQLNSEPRHTPAESASIIHDEIERLESTDPDAFVRLAYELYERALAIQDTRLGASHPLMAVVNRPRDRTSIDRLDEGIEDYRRSLAELNTEE